MSINKLENNTSQANNQLNLEKSNIDSYGDNKSTNIYDSQSIQLEEALLLYSFNDIVNNTRPSWDERESIVDVYNSATSLVNTDNTKEKAKESKASLNSYLADNELFFGTQYNRDLVKKLFYLKDYNNLFIKDNIQGIETIANCINVSAIRKLNCTLARDKFYLFSPLNCKEMEIMEQLVSLSPDPSSYNELSWIVINTYRYYATKGANYIKSLISNTIQIIEEAKVAINLNLHSKEELKEVLSKIPLNNESYIIDFISAKDILSKSYILQILDSYLDRIKSIKIQIPIVSFFLSGEISGSNINFKYPCLLFNYKGLYTYSWSYIKDIFTHECAHWIEHIYNQLCFDFIKNRKENAHNAKWFSICKEIYGVCPSVHNCLKMHYNDINHQGELVEAKAEEYFYILEKDDNAFLNSNSKIKVTFKKPLSLSSAEKLHEYKVNIEDKVQGIYSKYNAIITDGIEIYSLIDNLIDCRFY